MDNEHTQKLMSKQNILCFVVCVLSYAAQYCSLLAGYHKRQTTVDSMFLSSSIALVFFVFFCVFYFGVLF